MKMWLLNPATLLPTPDQNEPHELLEHDSELLNDAVTFSHIDI